MVGRACVGAGVFVCTYTVIMCMNVWLCKHACFHHIYMFSVCLHVRMFWGGPSCVCVEEKGGKSRPKFWNKVAWPAAVTDRLLCSFSTLVVFFKQFPLRHPPTSPNPHRKHPHRNPLYSFLSSRGSFVVPHLLLSKGKQRASQREEMKAV